MRFKFLAGAAIAALSLSAVATSASAITYIGQSIALEDPNAPIVNVFGQGTNVDAYSSSQVVTMVGGKVFTLDCIDFSHDDSLGGVNYVYNTTSFTTDYAPAGLDTTQLGQISYLLDIAPTLSLWNQDAVQSAIWVKEGEAVTSGDAAFQARINYYSGLTNTASPSDITVFATPSNQGLAAGGVPEPTTWALMILGFGGMGVALRRRRTTPATA